MSKDTTDPRSPAYPAPGEPLSPLQKAANLDIMKRNLSIGLLVACPILIAMPPRKLDMYTFCLAGTTFISLNHLQKHTTGRSFLNRIGINDSKPIGETVAEAAKGTASLPTERARQYQQMMREKKEAEAAGRKWMPPQQLSDVKPEAQRGVIEGLWLGNEKEDWKAKRDRKEREALERGDGIGVLIQDYFQEAMGYKKDDEDEEEETKK